MGAEGGVEGASKKEVCHVYFGSRAMGTAQGMCPSGSGCLVGTQRSREAHVGQNQSPGGGSGRGGSKQWQCHAMSQESQRRRGLPMGHLSVPQERQG